MKPLVRHFKHEGGFTIVEALVALLIMTFGMLAISGMQMTLSHNSDTARHRTEATRLANQKMEELRSFTDISTGTITWNSLADGSDVISTNASYTRTWALGGTISDAFRPVSVAVAWIDRSGETNGITLNSVISKTDPSDVGFLGFPLPQNTYLKRVKNRSLDIPIPAISLTNYSGYSGYNLSGTNLSIVFNDTDGTVVKSCPSSLTAGSSLSGCSTITASIVAGYIHDTRVGNSYNYRSTVTYSPGQVISVNNYVYSNSVVDIKCLKLSEPTALYYATQSGACPGGFTGYTNLDVMIFSSPMSYCQKSASANLNNDYFAPPGQSCKGGTTPNGTYNNYTLITGTATAVVTTTQVTTGAATYQGIKTGTNVIGTTGLSWWDVSSNTPTATSSRTVTCVVDQAIDQNSGSLLQTYFVNDSGLAYNYNFKYYLCVIYTGQQVAWSGTLKIKGIPYDSTDSSKQFVNCRYQYKTSLMNANQRNVQPYSLVQESLDNQNYLIEFSTTTSNTTTSVCPTTTLNASALLYATGNNSIPSNLQAEITAALQAATEIVLHQDCRNQTWNTTASTNCPKWP